MWGGLGFFFFPPFFSCLACASSIYFYSEVLETDRPAWRGGADSPSSLARQPPPSLRGSPPPAGVFLTPSHHPRLGCLPSPGSPSCQALGRGILRSQKAMSTQAASPG